MSSSFSALSGFLADGHVPSRRWKKPRESVESLLEDSSKGLEDSSKSPRRRCSAAFAVLRRGADGGRRTATCRGAYREDRVTRKRAVSTVWGWRTVSPVKLLKIWRFQYVFSARALPVRTNRLVTVGERQRYPDFRPSPTSRWLASRAVLVLPQMLEGLWDKDLPVC